MKSWQAEIVRVTDNHILTNADQESFPYQTRYGTELDPGHYLVLKMAGMQRQYKNGVVFFGPFASDAQAEMVLQSSRYLGLLTGKSPRSASVTDIQPEQNKINLPILLRRREPANLTIDHGASPQHHRARAG
ncbi:MAG: hypothetical protein WCD07_06680 [Burkholderiales bacterium]